MDDDQWRTLLPIEKLLMQQYVPDKPDIITVTITLSAPISLSALQNTIIPRLLQHPRFSSRLSSTSPLRFEPVPNFTPTSKALTTYHTRTAPQIPPDKPEHEQLRLYTAMISHLLCTPLDRSRPLWHLTILPAWSPTQKRRPISTTLILRVHHALSDGIGLVKYFLSHVTDHQNGSPTTLLVPPARHNTNSSRPWLRLFLDTLHDFSAISIKPFFRDSPSVFNRPPVVQASHCAILPPQCLAVATLKHAATRLGVTINDILFAALAGAMRSYVSDFGEHPELMHMRVAMPFNLHTYNAFQPSDVSNQLALLPVPLPVALASRRDRLIHCTESMRRVKRGCQPALAVKAIKSLSRLPMSVMRRLWSRVASSASALLSNVAGPTNLVSIGGIPVTCIYVFPPCDVHNTVNVAIFSYNGSFFVSVSGDAERLKYPQKLLDYYSDEVIALLDMADLEPAVQTNTS